MNNPYNCPQNIFEMMHTHDPEPLLYAVKKIGPDRIQWTDVRPGQIGPTDKLLQTCWRIVGTDRNATYAEIYDLSGGCK